MIKIDLLEGAHCDCGVRVKFKAPNKIAADDILFFTFTSRRKKGLIFHLKRIHLKHQVLFSLNNNEKICMNVVFCSRDWRFKG